MPIFSILIPFSHHVLAWLFDFGASLLPILNGIGFFFFKIRIALLFLLGIVLVWGINFIIWGSIGLIRLLLEDSLHWHPAKQEEVGKFYGISRDEVAVIVPAHNEELVIADTLNALLKIVPAERLYLVSDGSNDNTVSIAKRFNVHILDLQPSHGKAGALEECMRYFNLYDRYKAVLFVDADTRLKGNYLENALPFFRDPKIIAVAGYAQTMWDPKKQSWRQMLFLAHRDRVYFFNQMVIKFGQTWQHTNVTPIVPGFASIYRTSVLKKITMNPKGLIIEDFNMTFELHHKHLGVIAHHPSVVAYTQDPDNLHDYYHQIKRWHLGFWQTIRLHGFWPSKFWMALCVTLLETLLASVVFLLLPFAILAIIIFAIFSSHTNIQSATMLTLLLEVVFLAIWLPDYLMTIITAIFQKRPQYLLLGFGFPFIRFFDALAFLKAIPKGLFTNSSGQWVSPTRRTL